VLSSQFADVGCHIGGPATQKKEGTMWENSMIGLSMMWANHPHWIVIFVATVVAGIVVNVYHWMKEE